MSQSNKKQNLEISLINFSPLLSIYTPIKYVTEISSLRTSYMIKKIKSSNLLILESVKKLKKEEEREKCLLSLVLLTTELLRCLKEEVMIKK